MSTRRNFLVASMAAVCTAACPGSLFAERLGGEVFTNANLGAFQQGLLNMSTFRNLVGDDFRMFTENNGVERLTLTQVVDHSQPGDLPAFYTRAGDAPQSAEKREKTTQKSSIPLTRFSVLFSHSGTSIPQDTYVVDHGRLGRFALFVVANGPSTYSATFCNFENQYGRDAVLPRLAR